MLDISPESLAQLDTRVAYTHAFLDFASADAAALHAAVPVLVPLIPTIVDLVYEKLLGFSVTAASFVPRQTGFSGPAPAALDELTPDHPQIKFRKDFLAGYVRKLVTMDYEEAETWEYLDKVGRMHTGVLDSGFAHRKKKPGLRVEYMHCAILLGYVEDIIVSEVVKHPELDIDTKLAVIKAVNKILWLQNDLFARHYIQEQDSRPAVYPGNSIFSHKGALPIAVGLLAVVTVLVAKGLGRI